MTATNFKTLLRKNLDDVKKPEPLPEGSYRGIITNYSFGESAKKKTPFILFEVTVNEAMDGVDQDELASALQGHPITTKKLRSTFYVTDESLFRVKDFMSSMGIEISGRTLDEALPEVKNQEVLMEVSKRPSEDGETFYNDIAKIVGANA
jgi:hypothetical protein